MSTKINTVGRHAAIVQSVEFGETEKGTPYLSVTFSGNGEATEGTMFGYLYLSEKALANSIKTLRDAFGFDGNFETVVQQITGKPCSITNENEEFEGKERVKVKWINGPRTSKPISDQASFLKALSAKAARIPKEAPRSLAPTRQPAAAAANSGVKEPDPF